MKKGNSSLVISNLDSLLVCPYRKMPYSAQLEKVISSIALLLPQFFSQSQEHKDKYTFDETLGGYESKRVAGSCDNKETMSITSNLDWFTSHNIPSPLDYELFYQVYTFVELMRDPVKMYATELEKVSGRLIVKRAMKHYDSSTVRLLYYPAQQDFIFANDHADTGTITVVGYESVCGHQNLSEANRKNDLWEDIPVEKELVFFPGLGVQYLTDCLVKALTHRVVATEVSKKTGRYSMVLFADTNITTNKAVYGSVRDIFPENSHYDYDPNNPEDVKKFKSFFIEKP